MSRTIGIRHRIKRSAKGEARPTQVCILEEGKEPFVYELPDETAELDFVVGKFPSKWSVLPLGEAPDLSFPSHHILPFGERYKVPTEYDGLRPGDRVSMTLGGSGDYLAFALSLHGEKIGAEVFRIPPFKLKNARAEDSKDDDSLLLARLLEEKRELFLETDPKDRDLIRLREAYDGLEQARKARVACVQRLRQVTIGRVFCTPEFYHAGALEKAFDEAKANNPLLVLLKKEEDALEKSVIASLEAFPIWTEVLINVHGFGPKTAARIIAGAGDVRKFATVAKFKAYCGVHLMPADDGSTGPQFVFPRRRSGKVSNWNDQCRQGFYLFVQYCIKSKDSEWGQRFLAIKAKFRETHPEEVKVGNRRLYTKGHIHQMAIARTMTKFAEYVYREWSRLEARVPTEV